MTQASPPSEPLSSDGRARGWEAVYFYRRGFHNVPRMAAGIQRVFAFAAGLAAISIMQRLCNVLGRWTGEAIMCVVGLAFAGVYVLHRSSVRRAFRRAAVDDYPRGYYRLQCIGIPADLHRLGELHGALFEPLVFRARCAIPFTLGMRLFTLLLFCLLTLAQAWALRRLAGAWISVDSLLLLGFAGVLAVLGTEWVWPTYFRITPGRLEVLRYSRFRTSPCASRTYDLRTSEVLVDLPAGVAGVSSPDRSGVFDLHLLPSRRAFAYALFLGATSATHAPDLPHDTLA